MKALVTGASGLVGANLVRRLLARGHSVRALVRPTSDLRGLEGLEVERVYGDVRDLSSLRAAAEGCHVLFHAAAVFAYWGHTPEALETVAIEGARNAVRAAREAKVGRVVLTSSSVVCGSGWRAVPRDESGQLGADEQVPYFTAKALAERAAFDTARALGVDLVAVCPTITVGPHDYRLVPSNAGLINYLRDPLRTTYPGGCNVVHVDDVAEGHLLAAERGKPGERYLLGSENLEWSLIHRYLSELCGVAGPLVHANHTAALLMSSAAELWGKWSGQTPASTRDQARTVGRFYWYRHDKAVTELGYSPRPARQALAAALAWLLASPHVSRALRARLRPTEEVVAARAAMLKSEQQLEGGQ